MPDVWSNAVPAQIGNLNKDSTHPNPWSPPTEHERMMGCFQGYRIYNGNPKGPLQRGANFLEDDDFLGNIRLSINKGMAFGTLVAVNDIINVNRIDPWRARFV